MTNFMTQPKSNNIKKLEYYVRNEIKMSPKKIKNQNKLLFSFRSYL